MTDDGGHPARSSAQASPEIELEATGTDGPIPPVSEPSNVGPKLPDQDRQKRPKKPLTVASDSKRGKSLKSKRRPRLFVRQEKGSNSGTISSGVDELDRICVFDLRVTDNGRRIHLRYRDDDGTRHKPYVCHLVPEEWRQLRRRGYRSAVDLIAEKTANRTDGDPAKIRQAVERINLLRGALAE